MTSVETGTKTGDGSLASTKATYLILGSGIAGVAAAEAIREKDPEGKTVMISTEEELCFNRPMLIKDFALDGSGDALFEKQQNWPETTGVELLAGVEAEAVDPAKKTVRLEDGRSIGYDRLIYAFGAEASVPPIIGADRDNVFTVRTREDMRRIRSAMRQASHAVVIGGGMLGLEDAWALCEEKIDVAVIEQRQRLAFGQIDQSAGNLMKKRIERFGVPVYLNASVEEIGEGFVTFRENIESREDGGCCAVADGKACGMCCGQTTDELVTIPSDLVIISTGISPNSRLAEEAGLEIFSVAEGEQTKKWVSVNEYCQTSDPFIFAAGDAAAVNGRNDAIWDEARQMGRVAGTNAVIGLSGGNSADEYISYLPVEAEHVFTGFDTEVFTMADSSGAGTDGVYIRHADVEIFDYQRERYIRVSLQDGRMAGVLLINASELAPELMDAYANGAGEDEARSIIRRWKDSHDVDFKPAAPFRKR